jgi:hypothetical protein
MAFKSFSGLLASMIVSLPMMGCERSEPIPRRAIPVMEVTTPSAPEPTPEQMAKTIEEQRENQPEPTVNPEEPRETFALLLEKGRSELKGIYDERYNILIQMRDLKFDAKAEPDKVKVRKLANTIEGYALGDKREELESAAERFCKLIEELRAEAEPMEAEGTEALKRIDEELKALEEKQAGGGKVATSQYEKLEAQRKIVSGPVLGAKYVWLAMKTLFQEANVLAELGPRRAQIVLRDCLGAESFKPIPYELADKERQKVARRAKWYRSGHE